MMRYAFFAALLSVEMGWEEFLSLAREQLSIRHLYQLQLLQERFDLENILPSLLDAPIDKRGKLSEKQLEEALVMREHFPSFVFAFLDTHPTHEERLQHLPELLNTWYEYAKKQSNGFLHSYLQAEWDLRQVATRWRSERTDNSLASKESLPYLNVLSLFVELLKNAKTPLAEADALANARLAIISTLSDHLPWYSLEAIFAFAARLLAPDKLFYPSIPIPA